MRKFLSFLLLGMLLTVGNVWATEEACYTLTPASGSNNGYANNCDIAIGGITWNLTGNSTIQPWRIGGKSLSSVDRNLYSKTAISNNVSKIEVTHGAASGITVNSWTVIVSKNSDFSSPVSTLTPTFAASTTTTINRPDGKDWSNCYYKFVYNVSVSGSSNKFIEFTSAVFYETTGGGETPTCVMPTFSPAAGVYTSAQNVTISTTTEGATIYYTTDGTDPSAQGVVYANPISVSSSTQIKAVAKKEGSNNSTIASATFASLDHAGTQADPYTVADARSAIDLEIGKASVYASGIVSEIVTAYGYNNYQNVTFNFSADGETTSAQLQAFRCIGDDADEVAVGDVVVVSGNLIKFNDTYEFAQGCEVVSIQHPVHPIIVADNVNIAADATSGEITYSITNPVDAVSLTAASSTDWISNINVTADKVTFTTTANAAKIAREGFITLSYTGATDKVVTIMQAAYEEPNFIWDLSTDKTFTASATEMSWTNVHGSMIVVKGSAGTATNNYYPGTAGKSYTSTRFYLNSILTIAPAAGYSISSIVFTATSESYASALQSSSWTNATAAVSEKIVTVTPTSGHSAISATIGATCGFTAVKVYYEGPSDTTIVLGANGWSTFSANYKFSVSNAEVYTAKVNGNQTAVVLHKVENGIVPAEEGVILKGEQGQSATITPTNVEASEYDDNLNDLWETAVGLAYFSASVPVYVLSTFNGVTAFNPCDNITIPLNKAYLNFDGLTPAPGAIRIEYAENNATNIQNVEANDKAVKFIENGQLYILRDGVVYDAMGKTVR